MYGLSLDQDLSFLIGRQLLQVCVGEYQLVLTFDQDVAITIESEIEIFEREIAATDEPTPSANALDLLRAVGTQVKTMSIPGDGSLVITFDNGTTVKILDSNMDYESYQISNGSQIVIV